MVELHGRIVGYKLDLTPFMATTAKIVFDSDDYLLAGCVLIIEGRIENGKQNLHLYVWEDGVLMGMLYPPFELE